MTDGENYPGGGLSQEVPLLTIGELAKAFDLHPQTLRYYDEEGLIEPARFGDGGRRKYSYYDMYRVMLRRQQKNMGGNVRESGDIFHCCSLEKYLRFVDRCQRRTEAEKQRLEIRERGICRLRRGMDRIATCLGRCVYDERPDMWRVPHIVDKKLVQDESSNQARKILADTAPLCSFSFEFDPENTAAPDYYRWDVAANGGDAELAGLDKVPGAIFVPGKLCLYTIFRMTGREAVTVAQIKYALDFIRSNRLRACGKIYGNVIVEFTDFDGLTERYFEAWIAVEDDD